MSITALHPTTTFSVARAPQRCATPTQAAGKLRLTRRGRIVFASIVAVLGILLVAATLRPAGAVAEAPTPVVATTTVTVMPGETLWEIAGGLGFGGDVRDVVAQIKSLNELNGTSLQAGQPLVVPVP